MSQTSSKCCHFHDTAQGASVVRTHSQGTHAAVFPDAFANYLARASLVAITLHIDTNRRWCCGIISNRVGVQPSGSDRCAHLNLSSVVPDDLLEKGSRLSRFTTLVKRCAICLNFLAFFAGNVECRSLEFVVDYESNLHDAVCAVLVVDRRMGTRFWLDFARITTISHRFSPRVAPDAGCKHLQRSANTRSFHVFVCCTSGDILDCERNQASCHYWVFHRVLWPIANDCKCV